MGRLVSLVLESAIDDTTRNRIQEALEDIDDAFRDDTGRYDSKRRTASVTITLSYEHMPGDGYPSTTQTVTVAHKLPKVRGTSRPVRMGRHDGRGPTLELFEGEPMGLPLTSPQTTQS